MIRILLTIVLVFNFFASCWSPVQAISEDECNRKQKEDISQGISCWEELLEEVGREKESLKSEIARFDTKIALTAAQILRSIKKIEKLEKEIAALSAKIMRLDVSLNQLSEILIKRIAETYKKGRLDALELFLSSKGFSEFISRYKYLKVIQIHDRRLMVQMETARTNYDDQKTLKEQKQAQLEALKKKLELQKALLAQQKKEKEYLLEVTKNNEAKYQALLAAARAEQEAMHEAMRRALALLKDGTPVDKGAEIAFIGNTGYPYCSTGPHLHFEIRKDDSYENPASYLKDVSVAYADEQVGRMSFTGDWDWPVKNPEITQEFGMSYWARLGWYNGGPHTGIDIVSDDPVIRAPKEGILYKGSTVCGKSGINFVAIDHGDGLISWYWHVQ